MQEFVDAVVQNTRVFDVADVLLPALEHLSKECCSEHSFQNLVNHATEALEKAVGIGLHAVRDWTCSVPGIASCGNYCREQKVEEFFRAPMKDRSHCLIGMLLSTGTSRQPLTQRLVRGCRILYHPSEFQAGESQWPAAHREGSFWSYNLGRAMTSRGKGSESQTVRTEVGICQTHVSK